MREVIVFVELLLWDVEVRATALSTSCKNPFFFFFLFLKQRTQDDGQNIKNVIYY